MERGCRGSNRLSLLAPSAAATQARIREPRAPIPEAQRENGSGVTSAPVCPPEETTDNDCKSEEGRGAGDAKRQLRLDWREALGSGRWATGADSGWGGIGLDQKPQAERTGLNNQGWALPSPGDPVFTHLGWAIGSWTLPRLLGEASPACLGSATGVRAGCQPGAASSLAGSLVRHARAWRRQRSGEAAAGLGGGGGGVGRRGPARRGESRGRCSRGQLVRGAVGLLCRCLTASGALQGDHKSSSRVFDQKGGGGRSPMSNPECNQHALLKKFFLR